MAVVKITLVAALVALVVAGPARAQAEPYPAMAPLASYLMPEADEIALARSAAPKSISDAADVMVLRKDGYATVATGSNGFVCLVERGWAGDSTFADFWNPRQRSPICFNAEAARSYAQIYLMRTKLVLAGRSKQDSVRATAAALDGGQLPALAPGAMCYMMSRQQYLNDEDKAWAPHLMFFAPADATKSWGANLPGSPVIAANVPDERTTIFMIKAPQWSDGTPAPAMMHH
jgi:hypothetical protein